MKKSLFGVVASLLAILMFSSLALAQEAGAVPPSEWTPLGKGLLMGLAIIGGTLGQGRAIANTVESMGRNPSISGKLMTTMILGLALIESLVIFGFVIVFIKM